MSQFEDFLIRFELTGPEIVWDAFKEALACFDEETQPPEGVIYQPLFTIVRGSTSPWSGDERNFAGLFADPDSDWAILFFADDAGGFGKLWRISKTDADAFGNLISKELSEFGGWGPLQFYGTTLCNHAPDLVTRDFFVRLVREAFDRHPDLIHASDESYDSPEHFVEENYREW